MISLGWGNEPPVIAQARLNDEIRKRGTRLDAIKAVTEQEWKGRYAQDLKAEILEILEGW